MGCMGFEPGAAGWLAQTKPRSYTGHPLLFQLFLNGPSPASFSFIFGLFQTNNTIFTTNICEKMSIQYMVPGFEPMTFRT